MKITGAGGNSLAGTQWWTFAVFDHSTAGFLAELARTPYLEVSGHVLGKWPGADNLYSLYGRQAVKKLFQANMQNSLKHFSV